ncbi:MAG: hypothetical protein JJU36_00665 [Phycisphaeraceae bacterium]|nr:hypothetical protein [Phycisphaeraceae bacterium]
MLEDESRIDGPRTGTRPPGAAGHTLAEPGVGAIDDEDRDLLRRRAAAVLPGELIQPGEIVILLLKPSFLFVLLNCLGTIALFSGLSIAAWILAEYNVLQVRRADIALLGLSLIAARLSVSFLEWLGRIFVLTDRRVIRVRGVIRIQVFEASLMRIQHTLTMFSLRERICSLGTICFATAGTFTIEAAWDMIAKPLEVHQVVVNAIQKYGRGRS